MDTHTRARCCACSMLCAASSIARMRSSTLGFSLSLNALRFMLRYRASSVAVAFVNQNFAPLRSRYSSENLPL